MAAELAPADAVCFQHAGLPAAWICPRCGNFICEGCSRRTRPDAVPMCAACWDKRSNVVAPVKVSKPSTALQTAGLVVGIFALLPVPGVQIAGLVVSILGIVRAKDGPARAVRWRSVTGLCLTLTGVLIDVALYGLFVSH